MFAIKLEDIRQKFDSNSIIVRIIIQSNQTPEGPGYTDVRLRIAICFFTIKQI